MKPTRRMASIRTGCWCRGTAFPMSRKPFRLRSQSQPEENSKVSGWQQQYFDGVYYGVILADTVVPVWALYGKHAGAVSGAAIDISEGWEHCPFGTDHDDR